MLAAFKNFLPPLIALLFSSVGWFAQDIHQNGVSSAAGPLMLGGLSVSGIWMLVTAMAANYKKAGGKIDGKLTADELSAIAKTLTDQFAPQLSPFVNNAAKLTAPAINKAIPPSAVELIDSLSKWFTDATPDANESVLNHKLLDVLSVAVADDDEGRAAAATLRSRLHEVSHVRSDDIVVA